jgi:hypothetical protein
MYCSSSECKYTTHVRIRDINFIIAGAPCSNEDPIQLFRLDPLYNYEVSSSAVSVSPWVTLLMPRTLHSAEQQIPRLLWNPNVHYRLSYDATTRPCPVQMNPFHVITPILILSCHLRLTLSSGRFFSGFPTNILNALLTSPMRTTCPAHLIILDVNPEIGFYEECKL